MAEEEIKDLGTTTEEEEIDVTQLSDDDLKKKTSEIRKGAGKKEVEAGAGKKAESTVGSAAQSVAQTAASSVALPLTPEEIVKLRKQITDKEAFIQKQAREIGNLRKKVHPETEEEKEARLERQKQRFQEDPEAATAEMLENLEAKKTSRRDIIKALIPNLEEIKNDIAELVKAEGVETPENIEIFLNDPYTADPAKLRYWALEVQRNKDKTAFELRIADLEKKIQGGEQQIAKKITKAATETKTLTAKDGKEADTEGETTLSEEQIAYLSDEELREFTKKLRKKK